MSLITELKRRNVFRVALVYLVASWIILQVADVGISLLSLPATTGRLVFLLLAIGLPLVLVFSWAYEITPEGLKKESEVDRSTSVTHHTAKKLNAAVIVLLIIGIGALALDRLIPRQDATPDELDNISAAPERTIAVLPFVNMSADHENEYFSDGLSEELLNLLAKIPELQVAARTSAFRFKDSDADIAEIATQLNVAHVLEGSVRKSGGDIRITAQLIKASDGYHLWSHTWDRTLDDVFAIQDEIASAVVSELRVSLLGEMPKARVTDAAAYALYLQSKQASNLFSKEGFEESISLLTQALAIDPEYAAAWAELGRSNINMAGQGMIAAADGYSRARSANERALAIEPDNAEALSSQGWIAMYWERDFRKAATLIGKARAIAPGNASVLNAYAVLNFVFARTQAGIALYKEALARDPLSMSILANLAGSYLNANRLDEMEPLLARMKEIEPESVWPNIMAGWQHNLRGESEVALDYFAAAGGAAGTWGRAIAYYDMGQDQESNAALQELIEMGASPVQVAGVYAYRGQVDDAFAWLDKSYENPDAWTIEIRMFRILMSPLHGDSRWQEMLEKIGITDAVAESISL